MRQCLFTFCLIEWKKGRTPLWISHIWWVLSQGICWAKKNSKKTIRWPSKRPKTKNVNKCKQTPLRRLVARYSNIHKIEKLVFDLVYHPSKFQPCRLSQKKVRSFYNFPEKRPKSAKIKAEIIRSALAGERKHLETWLMAFWKALGLGKLGKHDFIFGHVHHFSIFSWPVS